MFNIAEGNEGVVVLEGRLDAVSAPIAREFLGTIENSCKLDFSQLEYIASIGLGLLAATQRRLMDRGEALTLTRMNPHLREVFALAGFEGVFRFE